MEEETTLKVKNNKGGRPPKSLQESRAVPVYWRWRADEFALAKRRAAEAGMDYAEYCRAAILRRPIRTVPQVNRESYIQLAGVANNLNQLTKLAHQQQNASVALTVIKDVQEAVHKLRAELIKTENNDTAHH